jgi:nucleolar protein 4
VAALHGREGLPGDLSTPRLWARQLSGEGLHIKRWRLVVRNLSFKASEEDLRAAFTPAGFVWEVSLPLGEGGAGRGFAFVGFQCKADAERGIKLVNATKVANRPVAVDWALSKRQYESAAVAGAAAGGTAPEGVAAEEGGSGDESSLDLEEGVDYASGDEEQQGKRIKVGT